MSVGRIHSIQSLGAVDGPGVRFVVFLQGCPLRCHCCHNPDTWDVTGGQEQEAAALVKKALRYREYFGRDGGVTLSGGEPLLQAEFCEEFFRLCHQEGLSTCLDTSGILLTDPVKALLSHTDRVLLDIKYTGEELYRKYVGCSYQPVLDFLDYLDEQSIKTTLRQVIIPTVNDDEENIRRLREIARAHPCVDKVELLPFRKVCQVKYDELGISFPFGDKPEPTAERMAQLKQMLKY